MAVGVFEKKRKGRAESSAEGGPSHPLLFRYSKVNQGEHNSSQLPLLSTNKSQTAYESDTQKGCSSARSERKAHLRKKPGKSVIVTIIEKYYS